MKDLGLIPDQDQQSRQHKQTDKVVVGSATQLGEGTATQTARQGQGSGQQQAGPGCQSREEVPAQPQEEREIQAMDRGQYPAKAAGAEVIDQPIERQVRDWVVIGGMVTNRNVLMETVMKQGKRIVIVVVLKIPASVFTQGQAQEA